MSRRTACSVRQELMAQSRHQRVPLQRAKTSPIVQLQCSRASEATQMAKDHLETKASARGDEGKAQTMNDHVGVREGELVASVLMLQLRALSQKKRRPQTKTRTPRTRDQVAAAMTANLDSCPHLQQSLYRLRPLLQKGELELKKRTRKAFWVGDLLTTPTYSNCTYPNVLNCCRCEVGLACSHGRRLRSALQALERGAGVLSLVD